VKFRLVSSKLGSSSLKRLAEGLSHTLGYRVFRSINSKPNRNNLKYGDCKDKIYQYKWFQEKQIPALDFTTSQNEAKEWASSVPVFCRLLTKASEGKGIVICETPESIVPAPVYTKYKKKKKEFRVHVFKDTVVHVLEKRKKTGFEGQRETKIRNLANGYVFCSDNVVEPVGLRDLALRASKVTQSHFRGVDIGYNEKKNELFVIEVNSAPGIDGTNVDRYVKVITE
jgi:hypothetical protein